MSLLNTDRPNSINSHSRNQEKRILVVTSVTAERDAVLRGLNNDTRFEVRVAGVGAIAAAANTAKVLAAADYDLVICAGIAGGFPGRAEVGSLVVANEAVAADLGAETPEGFSSLDELGFGSTRIQTDAGLVSRLTKALLAAGLPVNAGPILTVSTATGTTESASELAARVPGAAAEAMEGYGVAFAAHDRGVPFLELRAISNVVGPRDVTAWRIKEALDILQVASSVFLEVFI